MKETNKNLLYILLILFLTVFVSYGLTLIPNYLREVQPDDITFDQTSFIFVFLLFNLIFIGIPALIHWLYVKDYSPIRSVWFFVFFGGITGGLLGEGGSIVMIIPYSIIMFIYVQFYKRFPWWKVALTTYLGGILIENMMNRSPIQIPTLTWIAFLTYPYFVTKIWENRNKISIWKITKNFKWSFLFSIILGITAVYISRNNISPPLIILGITLPFIISVIYKIINELRN